MYTKHDVVGNVCDHSQEIPKDVLSFVETAVYSLIIVGTPDELPLKTARGLMKLAVNRAPPSNSAPSFTVVLPVTFGSNAMIEALEAEGLTESKFVTVLVRIGSDVYSRHYLIGCKPDSACVAKLRLVPCVAFPSSQTISYKFFRVSSVKVTCTLLRPPFLHPTISLTLTAGARLCHGSAPSPFGHSNLPRIHSPRTSPRTCVASSF